MSGSRDLASAFVAALDDAALDQLAERVAPRLSMWTASLTTSAHDRWLSSAEAAAHLGMTPNALHKLTAARAIPFEQDGPGCKLWFRRSELDRWREGGDPRPHPCRIG